MPLLTRRQALLIAAGLPLGAWAPARAVPAGEFWDTKLPPQWTAAERSQLLENSPWARPASVLVYGEPGSVRAPNARSGRAATTLPRESTAAQPLFQATVRWLSAAPLRAVLAAAGEGSDFAQNYVLQVTGDIPGLGGPRKDDVDDLSKEGTVEMLKQYTRLERKRGPLFLERIEAGPATHPGALFFFSRAEEITLGDKEVTFSTKMGPLDVKARFSLKAMLYQSALSL